jgi:general secretion pathway protein D
LPARNRTAEQLRASARAAETEGNLDVALRLATEAASLDPSDPAYALAVHRIRFEDGAMHIRAGYNHRAGGRLEQAMAEFLKASQADPASDLAVQEIRVTREMMARPPADEEEKSLTPVESDREASRKRNESLSSVPELHPLSGELLDLKMTNKPYILFETVCKLGGVNVIFDPDYDSQQTIRSQHLDISHTTLEQALDQLAMATRSFWKPLSTNTIFITLDNPVKRREYAEQVVKIFYLSNVTTPQEMQEILTVLRTVVDVQKVFSYTAQNALIVRTEADTMALVEKLIAGLDKPRSEVVLDVIVMEVSSTWTRALSTAVAGTGINTGVSFTPRPGITTPSSSTTTSSSSSTSSTTSTTSTSVPLSNLGHLSSADFSISSLPGATLEAVLNDSGTRILQKPQLRAVDNTKAELKIGDRVPTASGSFSAGTSTTTVSALVNTQFTYLDVGVNLAITPKVHSRDEVSLHLDLDVSQVKGEVNLGGINEPEISQNKMTADVRLREGEVSLIGGIIQQTDTKGVTGTPGLSSIPVLGRFFSSENLEKDRTELVIALVPHIVRAPSVTESDIRGVASGNATQIKVNYTAAALPPGTPLPAGPTLQFPPATAPPDNATRFTFTPASVDAQLGSQVSVTLYGENVPSLASLTAHLQFDQRLLRINNIVPTDMARQNGSEPKVTENILNDTGQADIAIATGPDGNAISGSGGLFSVVFQAIGRGNAVVTASRLPSGVSAQPLTITIR